jgi:hypothetical protein
MTMAEDFPIAGTDFADARFRGWLRDCLAHASSHFGLAVGGEPVFGWRLRSISASAKRHDQPVWLRVTSERPQWLPGDFWTGNTDASVFTDLAKPLVLDVTEWDDNQAQRRVRAEVMTMMAGQVCSPTDVLRQTLRLPTAWWDELRRTLAIVGRQATPRLSIDRDKLTRRFHAEFGDRSEPRVEKWETIHGDLHWANLLAPDFGLLDWEMWGRGPTGTDAATLYCYSLLVPDVARTVRENLADMLNTPSGHVAQIHVAARLLSRADQDYPDLAGPLRTHVQPLLDQIPEQP